MIDHYENPRNVGKLDAKKANVGTGLVGAPACGDVMRLQIEVGYHLNEPYHKIQVGLLKCRISQRSIFSREFLRMYLTICPCAELKPSHWSSYSFALNLSC